MSLVVSGIGVAVVVTGGVVLMMRVAAKSALVVLRRRLRGVGELVGVAGQDHDTATVNHKAKTAGIVRGKQESKRGKKNTEKKKKKKKK